LAFTHEEPLTAIMRGHISSYKDLPKYPYQFQVKFRNETRARSGIIRTREFIMKDLYSFSKNEEEHKRFYEKVADAYRKIFTRIGIGKNTIFTFASGGSFSKYSNELQTICDAGEDTIYLCEQCGVAVNEEIIKEHPSCPKCGKENLSAKKAVEVGNIFTLGTKFSEPLGLIFRDEDGKEKPVFMGSYGIGPGRVMGVVAELLSDEKGLVWPESISPFPAHLISIVSTGDKKASKDSDSLYLKIQKSGGEILYDDRDLRAGEKFADADLIGIPVRAVISEKTPKGKVEVKERGGNSPRLISHAEFIKIACGK